MRHGVYTYTCADKPYIYYGEVYVSLNAEGQVEVTQMIEWMPPSRHPDDMGAFVQYEVEYSVRNDPQGSHTIYTTSLSATFSTTIYPTYCSTHVRALYENGPGPWSNLQHQSVAPSGTLSVLCSGE